MLAFLWYSSMIPDEKEKHQFCPHKSEPYNWCEYRNSCIKSVHRKKHQQKDENALLTVTEFLNIPEETPSSCATTITKATEADVLITKKYLGKTSS